MKIKINLHNHTHEDAREGGIINYTVYDLIDRAHRENFQALALTGHDKFIYRKVYGDYARAKGILLIPGIELEFNKIFLGHILVLNCGAEVERIKGFKDLAEYKKNHPECFIIAAHPNSGPFGFRWIKKIAKHIEIFDALEHTWFYTKYYDPNIKSELLALKHLKPFIATSDIHTLKYLKTDYAIVEAETVTTEEIFRAIREHRFENFSHPKKVLEIAKHIFGFNFLFAWFLVKKFFKRRHD